MNNIAIFNEYRGQGIGSNILDKLCDWLRRQNISSIELVSCHIGLHHCPPQKLDAFIASITRVFKPGGRFILRDHNAQNIPMQTFCALVHTVFNAGLGVNWAENKAELRNFQGLDYWITALAKHNLINSQQYLLQQYAPHSTL
ncbi:GNAT family N-acetyltransferase [Photobacterium kishitanii]|nr:GNAT family N-acetyltransferase [Photobacterium kishitanii]